jgi:hypothetical protein
MTRRLAAEAQEELRRAGMAMEPTIARTVPRALKTVNYS